MKLKEKLKLELLLLLGNLYLVVILIIIGSLLSLMIVLVVTEKRVSSGTIKLIIFSVLVVFGILKGTFKTIFLKLPKPKGLSIERDEYSQFYDMIENIRKTTDCPKIDHILLISDMNAAIVERPSLGVLGLYKRYLLIGIPLLLTLTEEELKVVLAHECGHLSKAHGKSGVRLYRKKLLWENISLEFEKENSLGSFIVNWFIKRYVPALNSKYYSISKEQEYEADLIASKVVENQTLADALIKTSFYNFLIESKFWPSIGDLNNTVNNPLNNIYFKMEEEIKNYVPDENVTIFLSSVLKYKSLPYSTHPSYIERIEALGVGTHNTKIEKFTASALRNMFKEKSDNVLTAMSIMWSSMIKEIWENYYNEINEQHERLNKLTLQPQLDVEESIEKALLLEKLEGLEAALDFFMSIKEQFQNKPEVQYNIGRLLSYKGDEAGVEILREVMDKDEQLIPDCCYNIMNFYLYKNDKDEASAYYHYAVEFMKTHEDIQAERDSIMLDDTLVPHDLSIETVTNIRNELMKYKDIKKAYIAIKHVEFSSLFPIYVIGIHYKFSSKKEWESVQQELANNGLLPWEYWIVNLSGRNRQLEYSLNKLEESRIL